MAKQTDYSEQLKKPQWQRRRLEILELHDFTCEKCGNKEKTLHVHHTRYIKGRKVWEYDNDVLEVLCEDCHAKTHNKENEQIEITSKVIQIQNINNYLFVLTEDGKLYKRVHFDRVIQNGKNEFLQSTDWEKGTEWVYIPFTNKKTIYVHEYNFFNEDKPF